jgi:hypothetical protein
MLQNTPARQWARLYACMYIYTYIYLNFSMLQGYFTVTVLIMTHFVHSERLYWSGNHTQPQSNSLLEPGVISTSK